MPISESEHQKMMDISNSAVKDIVNIVDDPKDKLDMALAMGIEFLRKGIIFIHQMNREALDELIQIAKSDAMDAVYEREKNSIS